MPIESLNFAARRSLTPVAQNTRAPETVKDEEVDVEDNDAKTATQDQTPAPAAETESPTADLSSLRGAIVDLVI